MGTAREGDVLPLSSRRKAGGPKGHILALEIVTVDGEHIVIFGFRQPKHGPKLKNYTFAKNASKIVETSY
jgi:hypothetical protein